MLLFSYIQIPRSYTRWTLLILGITTHVLCAVAQSSLGPQTATSKQDDTLKASGTEEICQICDAAQKGDIEKVKELLKGNPDLANAKSGLGWTPLHAAADAGNRNIVELLVSSNASVDAKDHNGDTPLFRAAVRGHKEVAELLVVHGANVNAKQNDYLTFASSTPDRIMSGYIAAGYTALHATVSFQHADIAELLLAHGANANARTTNGDVPLGIAIWKHDMGMAELLLAHGADVNAATFLAEVVKEGNDSMAELLLAHGADVNAATPLAEAVMRGDKKMVELLLARGANVNARKNGKTPLGLAGDKEIAKLLRSHGGKK